MNGDTLNEGETFAPTGLEVFSKEILTKALVAAAIAFLATLLTGLQEVTK